MSRRAPGRDRVRLLTERDSLLSSIEDLEREAAAGDLDAAAFATLHEAEVARLAVVLRALEDAPVELGPVVATTSWHRFRRYLGRRRTRRVLSIGATVTVLGTIALAAAGLAGVRLPGQGATGGVSIPTDAAVQQSLAQAATYASAGQLNSAIELYNAVLAKVPLQPEALTYKGWLERLAGRADGAVGLVALGDAGLARAAQVAPRYADARGLYGIALLEDGGAGDVPRALAEFRAFCADPDPGAVLAAQGATMAAAFVRAHASVPKLLRPYVHASTSASAA
jgi:tetratricopeptide (TPR) repeat protein